MIMNLPKPRDCIQALGAYPLVPPLEGDASQILNLANNEYWRSPPQEIGKAVAEALQSMNVYPETSAGFLRKEIGDYFGLDADRIVCSNGSSELISMLCRVYCDAEDEIIVGPYSYLYFRTSSQIVDARIVKAGSHVGPLNIQDILDKVSDKTKIVFLDNPQNPIGTYQACEFTETLRQKLPDHILLVLDSAYAEFVDAEDYCPGQALVDSYANVVMLRTFSKIFGLAGIRIGWSYACDEITDLIHRVRQPNNVSGLSLAAASAAMKFCRPVSEIRSENTIARQALVKVMEQAGLQTYPSVTNFVLSKLPESYDGDGNYLTAQLRQQKILIRPMAGYGLPDHVRITVPNIEDIPRLGAALSAELMGSN